MLAVRSQEHEGIDSWCGSFNSLFFLRDADMNVRGFLPTLKYILYSKILAFNISSFRR